MAFKSEAAVGVAAQAKAGGTGAFLQTNNTIVSAPLSSSSGTEFASCEKCAAPFLQSRIQAVRARQLTHNFFGGSVQAAAFAK